MVELRCIFLCTSIELVCKFANFENIHNYNTQNKTNYRFDIHKIKSILIDGPKPEPRCSKDTKVRWGQSRFSGCSTVVE